MNKNFDNVMDVNEDVLNVIAEEKEFATRVMDYPSDYEPECDENGLDAYLADKAYEAEFIDSSDNDIDF